MNKTFAFILGALLAGCSPAMAQGIGVPSSGVVKLPSDFDVLRSVTAGTTQTQAGATPLMGTINLVTTGNASDGVALPLCAAGQGPPKRIAVVNNSAVILQVYGSGTDTINAVATATGIAQPAGNSATVPSAYEYICTDVVSGVGHWHFQ